MFYDQQQTLGHVIGGCETALLDSRYNWWHDSILLSIYKTIKSQGLQVFVHRDGYTNPSIITGDKQREDFAMQKVIIIVIRTHCRFWNKHSGNFWLENETLSTASCWAIKYKVNYVNLCLGSIGIIGNDSLIMTAMKNFDLSK